MEDHHEEDDLQKALRMSMQQQQESPEPKRSKAIDVNESSDAKNRRLQRELMAAAAEKRMMTSSSSSSSSSSPPVREPVVVVANTNAEAVGVEMNAEAEKGEKCEEMVVEEEEKKGWGEEMAIEEANALFSMVFGNDVSKGILTQWSNQGIRIEYMDLTVFFKVLIELDLTPNLDDLIQLSSETTKIGEVMYTTSLRMVCEVFCKQSAQDRDVGLETSQKGVHEEKLFKTCCMDWGEVNPTRAYYNGSCTSKDTEDPSWSTSFKTRRTQKTSSALEVLLETLFVLYLYLIGT
ncbi:ubiquitin carboxyl-terminal hydrolase MINDY-3, partial [Tanacetum coccineum]